MRSGTSFFNSTVFRSDLKRFWPVIVTVFLSTVFSDGLYTYNKWAGVSSAVYDATAHISDRLTQFHIIFSFITAAVIAVAVFFYLFGQKACNFAHSLPVSRRELFGTHTVFGVLTLTVPQLVSAALCLPVLLAHKGEYAYLPGLFVGIIVGGLLFFATATLCVMLTGHGFSAAAGYLLLSFFGVILDVGMRFADRLYTYGYSDATGLSPAILSPVVGLASGERFVWIDMVVYFCLAVLLLAAAYLFYSKRGLEAAGDMCAFRFVRPIGRWTPAVIGSFILIYYVNTVFDRMPGLLFIICFAAFSLVLFILAQMIIRKNVRIFTAKLMLEWAAGAAAVIVLVFGYTSLHSRLMMPDRDKIARATVGMSFGMSFEDPEDIQKVCELQDIAVANRREFGKYSQTVGYYSVVNDIGGTPVCSVRIKFELTGGREIYLCYPVPVTDENLDPETGILGRLSALETPERFFDSFYLSTFDTKEPEKAEIDLMSAGAGESGYTLDGEAAKELIAAYKKDIAEGNAAYRTVDIVKKYAAGQAVDAWAPENFCQITVYRPADDGDEASDLGGNDYRLTGYYMTNSGYVNWNWNEFDMYEDYRPDCFSVNMTVQPEEFRNVYSVILNITNTVKPDFENRY